MAKLYFKYGCMGSSKSAQALMTKFNYEERGHIVWLIKPSIEDRDGVNIIKSRVGLSEYCTVIFPEDKITVPPKHMLMPDVIIADECQFFTESQIEDLRHIVDAYNIPVLCYGLKTDFTTHLFPGSKRLLEIADSISEIKTVCSCGNKAIVNGRLDRNGDFTTKGDQILIGGDDIYTPVCYKCWRHFQE